MSKSVSVEIFKPELNPDFVRKVWAKRRRLARPVPLQQEEVQPAPIPRKTVAELSLEWIARREAMVALPTIECLPEIFPGKPIVKHIIRRIARKHGISPDLITGPCRQRWLIAIRHEAIAECAMLRPDMSLNALGYQFGGRDHTTILHALKKAGVPCSALDRRQQP